MELHPHPLFALPHPQLVAVKSLIYCLQVKFLFYGLSYEIRLVCVSVFKKVFIFQQHLDKMLELISIYSKIKYICDKGEMCHGGR